MTARTKPRARHEDENREPVGQEYLTPAEFAAALSVSIRTIRNWIAVGVVQATRVGPRLIRIPTTELQRVAVPIVEPVIARGSLGRSRR